MYYRAKTKPVAELHSVAVTMESSSSSDSLLTPISSLLPLSSPQLFPTPPESDTLSSLSPLSFTHSLAPSSTKTALRLEDSLEKQSRIQLLEDALLGAVVKSRRKELRLPKQQTTTLSVEGLENPPPPLACSTPGAQKKSFTRTEAAQDSESSEDNWILGLRGSTPRLVEDQVSEVMHVPSSVSGYLIYSHGKDWVERASGANVKVPFKEYIRIEGITESVEKARRIIEVIVRGSVVLKLSSQKSGELLNRDKFKPVMMEANRVGGAYITVDKETNNIHISGTRREVQESKDCIVKNIYKVTEDEDCVTISLTDN